MQFVPLLGKQLKDDDIIEVLELLETDVIYDFDRLHENQPDVYWASSQANGIELKFDAVQQLATIFLHISPEDDFAAFSLSDSDIPLFESPAEVESFGSAHHVQVTKGHSDSRGTNRIWVRLSFATHSAHYEFRGDNLALVTLSRSQS